jgi:hypothetical protein
MFARLARHFGTLADEVERAIIVKAAADEGKA